MKLTRVTISGADDGVAHEALYELSAEFPWVEWGLLFSRSNGGTPRYPSNDWLIKFDEDRVHNSLHLCGSVAREALGGRLPPFDKLPKRIQLNGFSNFVLPELLVARRYPQVEFILQCAHSRARHKARRWHQQYPNVSILDDASGGTGIYSPGSFSSHFDTTPQGYAGGITEDNVVATVQLLSALPPSSTLTEEPFWIDLENGARTSDVFDLDKVRRILLLTKDFVAL